MLPTKVQLRNPFVSLRESLGKNKATLAAGALNKLKKNEEAYGQFPIDMRREGKRNHEGYYDCPITRSPSTLLYD
eukprot:1152840-Pelagomonas_calceolata.AAC.2